MGLNREKIFTLLFSISQNKILIPIDVYKRQVGTLQTLVIALGAGLGIWGAINLMEGYGNDNPGANAHVR